MTPQDAKIEIVAKNYAKEDCDVNMLKRLAEDIYISGFKRGVEKAKIERSTNQFCDTTKKTDDVLLSRNEVIKAVDRHTTDDGTLDDDISCILEEVSLFEQKKSNSFSEEPSESIDSEMNSTKFKPGDKFILELGAERKMFNEFEIKGTDLYVKTDLLEKLTRYEPGENPGNLGENPGIIRCNACKYWIQTVGRMQGYGLGKCDFHDANLVNCNGFCYWAERRNDG